MKYYLHQLPIGIFVKHAILSQEVTGSPVMHQSLIGLDQSEQENQELTNYLMHYVNIRYINKGLAHIKYIFGVL